MGLRQLKERIELRGKGKPRDTKEGLEIIKRIFKAIQLLAPELTLIYTRVNGRPHTYVQTTYRNYTQRCVVFSRCIRRHKSVSPTRPYV